MRGRYLRSTFWAVASGVTLVWFATGTLYLMDATSRSIDQSYDPLELADAKI
ncbi:hypothetical protein BD309DRAFT_969209 [Dichomitus squalens]|nr:hypothetical protein BD309DRAFT_969209 [Dichomitus squalens]